MKSLLLILAMSVPAGALGGQLLSEAVENLSCAAPERNHAPTVDTLRNELREVSVTAIKSVARLDAQPQASTTITAAEVDRYNIVTMKQASALAPNLYIPDYGSRMTSSIYIRGIGARIDQPAVGLNVDNVPILNKDNYDFDLIDIDRIEVLRGPQSTLYGRNTMGGVINIYTLSPLRYQGVRLMGEYASGRAWKGAVSAYHLFNPDLGMSVSAYMTGQGGFWRNAYNGARVDHERQGTARWRTQWQPSGRLLIDNVASVTLSRQGGYPYESMESGLISHNDTCFYRRTGLTDGLTLRYRGRGYTLSSITSAQYIDDNMTLDQDFLPEPYFTLTQARREWALTQDVTIRGSHRFAAPKRSHDPTYRWMAGAFGFYKNMHMRAPVNFGPQGIDRLIVDNYNEHNPLYPISWDQANFLLNSRFTSPTWGAALYHESGYSAGRWDFAAAFRLDYERTSLEYRSTTEAGYTIHDPSGGVYSQVPIDIDDLGRLHRHDLKLLPRLTVKYRIGRTADDNVYLSISKGYKAGGYNTQMFSDVLQQRVMADMGLAMRYNVEQIITYRPEISWNYEIGWHQRLLDNRLTAQAAAFYIDCRDQQLTMFPPGTVTGRIMTNAGKTRSWGGELTLSYRPLECLSLQLSYGYTNARFVRYDNGQTDYSGKRVPYAPANTLFAGATYTRPLKWSWLRGVSLTASTRGVGSICWDEANTLTQPFYALLDVNATFSLPGDVQLELWGQNLTATRYATFYFMSMGNAFTQRGRPRQWGATLRININPG